MEIRELTGQDTFLLMKMVSKIGVTDLIQTYQESQAEQQKEIRKHQEEGKEFTEEEYINIGYSVIGPVLDFVLANMTKIQEDINKLLADLTGKTVKEIKELSFTDYNLLIIKVFKQDAFKDFFKQLFSSMK